MNLHNLTKPAPLSAVRPPLPAISSQLCHAVNALALILLVLGLEVGLGGRLRAEDGDRALPDRASRAETDLALAAAAPVRVVRMPKLSLTGQEAGFLAVELDGQGDENAFGFSVSFNPAVLSFTEVRLASGVNAFLLVNTRQVEQGRVGVALALSAGSSFPAGKQTILEVGFRAQPGMEGVQTKAGFIDQPIAREVASPQAKVLTAAFESGLVAIADPAKPGTVREPPFKLGPLGTKSTGAFQLRLAGELAEQYAVEVSTDLAQWTALKKVTLNGNVSEFLDEEAAKFPGRFYRAVRVESAGARGR